MAEVTGIDHIYVAVSNLARSEAFYDCVMLDVMGFRKNKFALGGDPARPLRARLASRLSACRIRRRRAGCCAATSRVGHRGSEAQPHAQYAPDYWATFLTDPDGVRLEVTNYRQERRDRHDHWERTAF